MYFAFSVFITLMHQLQKCHASEIYDNTSFVTQLTYNDSVDTTNVEFGETPKPCGGDLSNASGSFASPGYPKLQYNNQSCFWRIIGAGNQQVKINWMMRERHENSSVCPNWVHFMDGVADDFNLRFCGNTRIHPPITTFSSMLGVRMIPGHVPFRGIFATYYILNKFDCGGRFTDNQGEIKFVFGSKGYPGSTICSWEITVASGKNLVLEFPHLSIEPGSIHGCTNDYLEIRRSPFSTFQFVGRYYNSNRPAKRLKLYENIAHVIFYSNQLIPYGGFRLKWTSSSPVCGDSERFSLSGVVSSPGYPQPLQRPLNCTWIISVSKGNSIEIRFNHIDLPQKNSGKCINEETYIEMWGGLRLLSRHFGKFCSIKGVPILESGVETIHISLKFGLHYKPYKGFQLTYSANCDRVLTDFSGEISSLNYPDVYPGDHKCKWIIRATGNNKVHIEFTHFHLKQAHNDGKCIYEYLQITEWEQSGDTKETVELGKFCGSTKPEPISSDSNHVEISFRSDSFPSTCGFLLKWKQLLECGRMIDRNGFPTNISSPGYPNRYRNSQDCTWLIRAPFTFIAVRITIMDLEIEKVDNCSFDGLQIFSGMNRFSPLLLQTCGTMSSQIVATSLNNFMYVRFYSDDSVTMRGFHALVEDVYVANGCGGKFQGDSGYIYSPRYPHNYNINKLCRFEISVEKTFAVEISFVEFNLEHCSGCSRNYVAIYKIKMEYEEMMKMLCGEIGPEDRLLKITSNVIRIKFMSNELDTGKGFKAKYSISCGAWLERKWDTISYKRDFLNCSWNIINSSANNSKQITLFFTHIQWSLSGEECSSKLIEIYDGVVDPDKEMNLSEPRILYSQCCGKFPFPITSTKGGLTLRVSGQHKFRAVYHTESPACSQIMTSATGSISEPLYSKFSVPQVECMWIIQKWTGYETHLNFTLFDIESSENCSNNFLTLAQGALPGTTLGIYCGEDMPGNNISSTENVWVIFKGRILNEDNRFSLNFWRTPRTLLEVINVPSKCLDKLQFHVYFLVILVVTGMF